MIRKGTNVVWDDGKGTAEGKVIDTYTRKRNNSPGCPPVKSKNTTRHKVLLIQQADGHRLIKKEREVRRRDTRPPS